MPDRSRLHVVNFTDIQMYIYDKCPHDELTIIMRRYMMKIAEYIAKRDGMSVASDHRGKYRPGGKPDDAESGSVTNEVCTMPVFRPVIGFDKQDIVDISEKINTL